MRALPRRLVALLLAAPLLAGCGTPPWREVTTSSSTAGPRTASPSPSVTAKPAQNDLAKGSTKRTLPAGGVTLGVTYFSTLAINRWTPTATKPLSIAVTGSFADRSKQDIFLQQVTVTIDVAGTDGPLAAPEPLSDRADVTPGYLITSPNSYSQVFTVPVLPAEARSVTLNLTYELLAQSAPKSSTYLKQSASDTLVVALTED